MMHVYFTYDTWLDFYLESEKHVVDAKTPS